MIIAITEVHHEIVETDHGTYCRWSDGRWYKILGGKQIPLNAEAAGDMEFVYEQFLLDKENVELWE